MVDRETINEVSRLIVERFKPERVVLFGSYAGDRAVPHSDVDLLIDLDQEDVGDQERLIRHAIMETYPIPLDIIVRTSEEVQSETRKWYSVAGQALRYGVVLYDRKAA